MSRFWAAEGFSSDSDDSSDDSSHSSEDVAPQGGGGYAKGGRGGAGATSQWAELSDDSASEDDVRVVKSAKDRASEQLQNHISAIRNASKINDWSKVQSEFDALVRLVEKSKTLTAGGTPRFYVRLLCDLEDKVRLALADKASFKKLSATNGRALNRMKLTLHKHNKPYESVMEQYRANPVVSSSSSSESESAKKGAEDSDDSDSESDSGYSSSSSSSTSSSGGSSSDSGKVSPKKKTKAVKDEDDDSEDWGSSSESSEDSSSSSSSSSSDDEDEEGVSQLKGRAKWLKRTDAVVEEKASKNKEERGKLRAEAKAAAAAALASVAEAGLPSTKSLLPEDETLTQALLEKKCKEIVSSRGRRATDTKQILRQLEALCKLTRANRRTLGPDSARVEIPILMHTVTAQFDLQRGIDDFMETAVWKSCHGYLSRIADILEQDPELRLYAFTAEDAADELLTNAASTTTDNKNNDSDETENERAERLRIEALQNMSKEERKTIRVIGSLSSFMIRLEEEYVKSLQQTSPHSAEYVVRLRDEGNLVELLKRVRLYYVRVAENAEAAQLAQLEVEHIYYRHDFIAKAVDRASKFDQTFGVVSMLHPACISSSATQMKKFDATKIHPGSCGGKPQITEDSVQPDTEQRITDLCTFVYQHGSDRSRTRAMLCHIFFIALHDKFLEARDLLLMSKLQDTIGNAVADVPTMILFNRMMVTLGLSAFRQGRINDAHQCLADICSGRVRELLAQGVSMGRFSDKSTEQEKMEKRRQIPYHQHINLDLLEAAHLISAMLLEVPNMASAAGKAGGRRRIISRTFRRNFDHYERQVFTSAMPEQTRDFVMCAAKNLMKGDWKKCSQLLCSMDVWQLVPGDDAASKIKQMIVERTKLEGLRTYLFAYSSHYDSLSLAQLCNMFEMEKNEVHCVISKMIINQELHASLDQPTGSIVLRKVEPSQLQTLALQFSEKAAALLEANERLLDARSGKSKEGDWKTKQVGWHDRGDGQRRQGGDVRRGRGLGRGVGRSGRSLEGRGRGGRGGARRPTTYRKV